MKFLGQGFQKL